MFGFLRRLLGGCSPPNRPSKELTIESYACNSLIKLPRPVKTPGGSRVTVLRVWVDVDYTIKGSEVFVRRVSLARDGGTITGSESLNVASDRTGEAWHDTSLCPDSVLRQAVQKDMDAAGSGLRRIMHAKWRDANNGPLLADLVAALNVQEPPDRIAELIRLAGRGSKITFTYTKPDGTSAVRHASVWGISANLLRAKDYEDGTLKSFRLDRISDVRAGA